MQGADLGQGRVVPTEQRVAWQLDRLAVGVDSSWEPHARALGVQEAPAIGEALGNVTEDGSFKGNSQPQGLGPPNLGDRERTPRQRLTLTATLRSPQDHCKRPPGLESPETTSTSQRN